MLILVSDAGPGIADPEAALTRGNDGERDGSTGLGLDIVRQMAEATGGDVRVGSSVYGGAEIRVWIQLNGAPGEQTRRRDRRSPAAGAGRASRRAEEEPRESPYADRRTGSPVRGSGARSHVRAPACGFPFTDPAYGCPCADPAYGFPVQPLRVRVPFTGFPVRRSACGLRVRGSARGPPRARADRPGAPVETGTGQDARPEPSAVGHNTTRAPSGSATVPPAWPGA